MVLLRKIVVMNLGYLDHLRIVHCLDDLGGAVFPLNSICSC